MNNKFVGIDHVFKYLINMNAVLDSSGRIYNRLIFDIRFNYRNQIYKKTLQILFSQDTRDEEALTIVIEYPEHDKSINYTFSESQEYYLYNLGFLSKVTDSDNKLVISRIMDKVLSWIDGPMKEYHLSVNSIKFNRELSE